MGEVDQILGLLEETKISFIDYYKLNPINLKHLYPGRDVDSLNKSSEEIKNYCIKYFDEIINKIELIKNDREDHDFVFLSLTENVYQLHKNVTTVDSEGKKSIPLFNIFDLLFSIISKLSDEIKQINNRDIKEKQDQVLFEMEENRNKIYEEYQKLKLLSSDFKHKEAQKIYENDAVKFEKISGRYEKAFYILVLFLILYFLGVTFYVPELKMWSLRISFPTKIHGNLSLEFYIQKISLLLISTTLLAFLLKRSFMYRRLADDAYRTSKELIALPRYIQDLPQEMQDKIHFDLAYKYFGNGIHHDSYTSGENLMHENIKANTDFIKAVKDLSPKVEVPNTDAPKEDKATKDAA
ncbi:hypothetical protein ACG9Y4_05335 [Acinetobacter guillouiae]|uniref:hypothetical protein n=1 Tax=Acinetobacter guillouiae TaxID=106649 RepID=UPI003AF60467